MEAVWTHGPSTAREVCGRMKGREARAYTTIMTTLDRLHRKGLLSRSKEGLAWRYAARLEREAFTRAVADRLVSAVLSSHGEIALTAFVDAAGTDPALLRKLEDLVARFRKDRR